MYAPNEGIPNELASKPRVCSVAQLLSEERLHIPPYQRPYKWTTRHVNDLFSDLARHADKSAYRLGTVVLHHDGTHLNLVDGQQRTLTLLLAVKAMLERGVAKPWENRDLRDALDNLRHRIDGFCGSFRFESDISQANLKLNYAEILGIVARLDFTDERALYLLNSCEVVVFSLKRIPEAFQFFDSQNARGRDLDPHDLLKACHLREFGPSHEQGDLMTRTIEKWEALESNQLAHFFENYWFRIRNWGRGRTARYFGKDDVKIFKGVNLTDALRYPNTQILRIAHVFTDHHQAQYERQIDAVMQPYPFQFDQTILNGRRFFEMTSHYLGLVERFTSDPELKRAGEKPKPRFPEGALNGYAKDIVTVLDQYDGRHRRGDGYVRNLFDCLLLFYIDRFGMDEISRAIEKIFIFAYSLRLKYDRLQLASVDNHALSDPFPFQVLRDATHPIDFLRIPLSPPDRIARPVEEIQELFRKMNYSAS